MKGFLEMLVNTLKANPKIIKINIMWSYMRSQSSKSISKTQKAISLNFRQHWVAGGNPSVL